MPKPIRNVLVVGKKFVGMLSGVHASIRFDLLLYRSVRPSRHGGFAPSRRLQFNDTHGMASQTRRWSHACPKCERVSNLVNGAGTWWNLRETVSTADIC
jgi:hypothetical protein